MISKPELLAPVGNLEMLKAAVHNGADAIYFGMPGFNARGRTEDFDTQELQEIISYAHLYDVKVYIAFNILIFENEIDKVIKCLYQVIPLGVDAFIVQDLGLAKLIKKIAPQQSIHASTQMSISNDLAIKETKDLSLDRYVMARENSIQDLTYIKTKTNKELEVFIHGALCVAYSGQCLSSEHKGGRSANRGQCAQDCRMSYDLIVDGKKKHLKEQRYLVSPKDLCLLQDIPKLCNINIDSLKIEGRLKSAEYVASTVKAYRQMIDLNHSDISKNDLAPLYSRGFFTGWLYGNNHQQLVDGSFGNHRGLFIGNILQADEKHIKIKTSIKLNKGDGLLIANDKTERLIGGRIYQLSEKNNTYSIQFSNDVNLHYVQNGLKVYLNNKPILNKSLQKTWQDRNNLKRIPLNINIIAKRDSPLYIHLNDGKYDIELKTQEIIEHAKNKPISYQDIKKQLIKLEHTIYTLNKIKIHLDDQLFIPQKILRQLKNKALEILNHKRCNTPPNKIHKHINTTSLITTKKTLSPKLTLLLREPKQLNAIEDYKVDTIYLDFEHGSSYQKYIKIIQSYNIKAGIATTRILKPHEEKNLDEIIKCNPDTILVRNLGALNYLKHKPIKAQLVADFSLNCTNHITAHYLTNKQFSRLTPSYDLNKKQVIDMINHSDNNWEITIHQYMPEFYMQHCVFASFLTDATDYPDCKLICEKKRIDLLDKSGHIHHVKADMECRNTVFNSTPQSAVSLIHTLANKVEYFRIEALFESSAEITKKIKNYQKFLNSQITETQLFNNLKIVEKYGICEGQLENNQTYKDKKKANKYK